MLFAILIAFAGAAIAAPTRQVPLARRWANESVVWEHVRHGREILGDYEVCSTLCDWMSNYDDSTPLSSLSVPGSHDTA